MDVETQLVTLTLLVPVKVEEVNANLVLEVLGEVDVVDAQVHAGATRSVCSPATRGSAHHECR
eukprot:6298694-Amphidinium_carterae.1